MEKWYVSMNDSFMSGWGRAKGLTNRLVIVCENRDQALMIVRAAEKRQEMKYINVSLCKPRERSHWLISWKSFEEMSGWHDRD